VGTHGPSAVPAAVVCAGASAGGVDALRAFVAGFDASFRGSLVVVLHIAPSAGSALDRILARASGMRSIQATDGLVLEAGTVYVPRPDNHLLLDDGRVRVWHGPREKGVRPAIDALFRTAAAAYGEGSIGVLLSGTGDDGAAGLAAIKAAGGMALVQDPEDAVYREMPARALGSVEVDAVGTPSELAAAAIERTTALGHAAARHGSGIGGSRRNREMLRTLLADADGRQFPEVAGG
jgi:two-component system chemotaxis response regulator CheB